jgi:hypothetical protein
VFFKLTTIFSIVAVAALVAFSPSTSFADIKTAKVCDAEYAANKAAIQGGGQKKADFVTACRAGTEVIPGGAATAAPATIAAPAATVKSVKQCDAEYASNKDAIKAGGQTKKDFVAACRAGTEVIPTASTTSTPAAAPPPTTTVAPTTPKAPKNVAPAPSASTAPTGANEFAAEAQAKAHCPAGIVVWVNLKSQIWHWAGTRDYGTTEKGAYMCETDAKTEGARAAKNEKAPS